MLYLDYAATKKEIPDYIIEKICDVLKATTGNPSSSYELGRESKNLIGEARNNIAQFIGCRPEEIIFTSGGSESDNLAIKGAVFASQRDKKHIITTKIEHKAVLESCRFLEKQGIADITYIDVDKNGYVNPKMVEEAIRDDTILISIMFMNNEVGTIQPIKEISRIAKKHGILMHTDGVQMIGKYKINISEYDVNMMSASGHKFGTPKGIGFLYVKRGTQVAPLIHGGSQEFGLRSGTENVAYIAALGEAVKNVAYLDLKEISSEMRYLIEMLELKFGDRFYFVGTKENLSDILTFAIYDFDAMELQAFLDMNNVYVSVGSACNSGKKYKSHVLQAINIPWGMEHSFIRISISNDVSNSDLEYFVHLLDFYDSIKNPACNKKMEMRR